MSTQQNQIQSARGSTIPIITNLNPDSRMGSAENLQQPTPPDIGVTATASVKEIQM